MRDSLKKNYEIIPLLLNILTKDKLVSPKTLQIF